MREASDIQYNRLEQISNDFNDPALRAGVAHADNVCSASRQLVDGRRSGNILRREKKGRKQIVARKSESKA